MALLSKAAPVDFSLTIMGGRDKGTVINLVKGKITIGRGSDNDIVIEDDPKVSRNHAKLTVNDKGVQISDISDRNKVMVNGEAIRSRDLREGDVIELGDTRFRFYSGGNRNNVPAPIEMESASDAAIMPLSTRAQMRPPAASPKAVRPQARGGTTRRKPTFYIIVGVVIIFFLWIYLSKPAPTNKPAEIDDAQAVINSNEKTVQEVTAERDREGHNSIQYKEAQPNFIKGFRDYYKGQYQRAIESFQACLSLFPGHKQCDYYLKLAIKKQDELIQYHMILGGQYKEQGQYNACVNEYNNVMEMIKEPGDKAFQEARSGRDACKTLSEEKY